MTKSFILKNNTLYISYTLSAMERLVIAAVRAALKAGEEIIRIYNTPGKEIPTERKADHSPLTLADRKSHEIIQTFLKENPYPLLSEEGGETDFEERQHWKTFWLIDPLDGTKEFIKKNGEFTVNIALIDRHTPILGVIYVPVKRALYYGSTGKGAFKITGISYASGLTEEILRRGAERLPLPSGKRPFTVVASRSHANPETRRFIGELEKKHTPLQLLSIGSSLKICLVAEGKADLYPRFAPTMEWDTAAGHAIALAAGKNIYRYDGKNPLTYNKKDLHNPWFIVK